MEMIINAERIEVTEATSVSEISSCDNFNCTCQGCVWDG